MECSEQLVIQLLKIFDLLIELGYGIVVGLLNECHLFRIGLNLLLVILLLIINTNLLMKIQLLGAFHGLNFDFKFDNHFALFGALFSNLLDFLRQFQILCLSQFSLAL